MSIVDVLERSAEAFNVARLETHLEKPKNHKLKNLQRLKEEDVAAALSRAEGRWDALAFAKIDGSFEQRKAAYQFPGKCYADLARKAVLSTVEMFRDVTCIIHNDQYRDCVHICATCEDHFRGSDVEVDHMGNELYTILVAFLDCSVPGWCILPERDTVTPKPNYSWGSGYRSRLKEAHRATTTETESAYWQRVKNISKRRWCEDGLADKFVAFHNSAAKLQTLCLACHDEKTNARASFKSSTYVRTAEPVYIEALGKSKKRKLNEELNKQALEEEAATLNNEHIKSLVIGLREAIVSMQRAQIVDALSKVPLTLRNVIPMVKTATQLVDDIDLYDANGAHIALNPLPTDPFAQRTATICWKA
jgi:hypothetical protein|tara:strand:+ start:3441 stop:4529 length:1089 start_codon:yes stop_codon:yes gene_type:complete